MSCSHPSASWVSLWSPSSMGHAGFTLALPCLTLLTCRKQLSLLVGLGGCNGPEKTEAWEGEARVKRSAGMFLDCHKPPLTCHERQCGWNYLVHHRGTVLLFHTALLSVLLSQIFCSSASSLVSLHASQFNPAERSTPNFCFINTGKLLHGLYFSWRLMLYFMHLY